MFVSDREISVLIAGVGIEEDELRRRNELASSLRDAGMKIISVARCETPEDIAAAAVKDDVDVIGLSLNDIHDTTCQRVVALLRANSMEDVLVVACGPVPEAKAHRLEEEGISKAFPLGAPASAVINYVQTHVRAPWAIPDNPQLQFM
jgi:methylmalonyl-CoA mutase C-terminal domain/subunit